MKFSGTISWPELCAKGCDAAQGHVSDLCRRTGQTHHISGNGRKPETMILKCWKSVKSVVCGEEKLAHGLCQPRGLRGLAPWSICTLDQSLKQHAVFWAWESTFLLHVLSVLPKAYL